MSIIQTIDDIDIFDEKISNHNDLIIKISLPTCKPCKIINYIIEGYIKEHDKYKFFDINYIDLYDELIERGFNIKQFPTLIYFNEGKKIKEMKCINEDDFYIFLENLK